ncbi:MAG: hypothetical protein M1831_000780 [Alyxoria varia]|nr:MAG: hypothetical protein M1831_000780 [Alyxoria varia]
MAARTLQLCPGCNESRPSALFVFWGRKNAHKPATLWCGHCKWPSLLGHRWGRCFYPHAVKKAKADFLQEVQQFLDEKIAAGELDEEMDRKACMDIIRNTHPPKKKRGGGAKTTRGWAIVGGGADDEESEDDDNSAAGDADSETASDCIVPAGNPTAPSNTNMKSLFKEKSDEEMADAGAALAPAPANPTNPTNNQAPTTPHAPPLPHPNTATTLNPYFSYLRTLTNALPIERLAPLHQDLYLLSNACSRVGQALPQMMQAFNIAVHEPSMLEDLLEHMPRSRWTIVGVLMDAAVEGMEVNLRPGGGGGISVGGSQPVVKEENEQ